MTAAEKPRWLTLPWLAPAVVAVLATGVSLVGMGARSLWLDEAYTLSVARASWGELWDVLPVNGGNMSLYLLLMVGWVDVGLSEAVLRLPSAVFAVAAAVLVYRLGMRIYGPRVGLVAGVLLVANPWFIRYAQEARGYSLTLLLVTSAWLALLRLVERPTAGRAAALGGLAALSLYGHLIAAFFVGAQALTVRLLPQGTVPHRRLLLAAGVFTVVAVPQLLLVMDDSTTLPTWVPAIGADSVVDSARVVLGGHGTPEAIVFAVACLAGAVPLVRLGGTRRAVTTRVSLVPLVWLTAPASMIAIVSLAQPIMVPRYLLPAIPAGCLLAAVALDRLLSPRGIAVAAAAVLLAGVVAGPNLEMHDEWREATTFVLGDSEADDGIVFLGWGRPAFEHYWEQLGRPANVPHPVEPDARWSRARRNYERGTVADVVAAAGRHDRFWVISERAVEPEVVRRTDQALRRSHERTGRWEFEGPIVVFRYDAR